MAVIYRYRETVWPSIEAAIPILQDARKSVDSAEAKAGINFAIVLSSACFVEGILETTLRALLKSRRDTFNRVDIPKFEPRRAMNVFYNSVEEHLDSVISGTTGAQNYDQMFELLTEVPLRALTCVGPRWEGIVTLFAFRNVLGHGREVVATKYRGPRTNGKWEEDFSGGYARVEEYLRKLGVLDARFIEGHSEYIFLSDGIADHFWPVARDVPSAIVESLSGQDREAVRESIRRTRTVP